MLNYEYSHQSQQQNNQRHINHNPNNANPIARGNNSDRHDTYDGQQQPSRYDQMRHVDDKTGSSVPSNAHHHHSQLANNYMPPRYPQGSSSDNQSRQQVYSRQGVGSSSYSQDGAGASSQQQQPGMLGYNMFSPTSNHQGVIPKGGTGATDDSFLSSYKGQQVAGQYAPAGFNNPNFSSITMNANSFQLGADVQSNSFDTVAANRVGSKMFSNTATDWNVGQRAQYLEMPSSAQANDHISETRSNNNNWINNEYNKIDSKYLRDNSLNAAQRQNDQFQGGGQQQPQYFINQRHVPKPQLDRLEDDDQRSPERRPSKVMIDEISYSPERGGENTYDFGQQRSQSAMINSGFGPSTQQRNTTNVTQNSQYTRTTQSRASQQQQSYSPSSYLRPSKQNNSSTLSDLLQARTASRTPQANLMQSHKQKSPSPLQTSSKQVSAPQKSRKNGRRKTVLDQKEQFKIRPARCYMGTEIPQVHYSQRTLTWQDAIGCIEDLGVDMSAHYKEENSTQKQLYQNFGNDFEENHSNFKQVARSDGFHNWNNKPQQRQDGQNNQIQTDFYQRGAGNLTTINYDDDMSQNEMMGHPSHTQVLTKKSLMQNNHLNQPSRKQHRQAESLSSDSAQNEGRNNQGFSNQHQSPQRVTQKTLQQKEAQQKSPNFKLIDDLDNLVESQKQCQPVSEAEAIQTLKNLRYSDLIYLLNILKLQRSKNAEAFKNERQEISWQEARDQWITDLQLALSVAISAEERDSKDTTTIAHILIEKVEACRNEKFASSSIEQQPKSPDLKYEHFIGPLVLICATNNLFRAQSQNSEDQECISTIRLCFDQFERYYAKQVTVSQRRTNSMSGNAIPNSRMDSLEVQPEPFKNFIVSLKTFIEQQSLPCKANLKQALESITLDKVHSSHLIFPQGNQLILSQLNRLFGLHIGLQNSAQAYDPLENQSPARGSPNGKKIQVTKTTYNARGSLYDQQDRLERNLCCPIHGITYCPCDQGSSIQPKSLQNQVESSNENLLMSSIVTKTNNNGQQQQIQHFGNNQKQQATATVEQQQLQTSKQPSYTLQPQFSSGSQGERAAYYQKSQQTQHERRQHSMHDFSASRRLKTQDSGYGTNQDGTMALNMAAQYRPFSTIVSGHLEEEDSVRPSLHTDKNQPLSLELQHKRSINMMTSKSVQKPKKGILKQSSSYLESSQKKQPVHFKHSSKQNQMQGHQTSPYMVMNKKKVLKQAGSYPVDRPSNKKLGSLRYDSQKNLLQSLCHDEEPPKFSHASTAKSSLLNHKMVPDFNNNENEVLGGTYNKKLIKTVNQGQYMKQANKLSSLAQILRTSSQNQTPQNQRQVDEQQHHRQSPSRLSSKYQMSYNPQNSSNNETSAGPTLSSTSMKYLRAAQTTKNTYNGVVSKQTHHSSNTAHHSNVLQNAQNIQNRNDSFGVQSNYSHQQNQQQQLQNQNQSKATNFNHHNQRAAPDNSGPKTYGSNLIQSLMSPQATSGQSRLVSTMNQNLHLLSQSPGNNHNQKPSLNQQSPSRNNTSSHSHLIQSAKRSASFQGGNSSSNNQNRLSGSGGFNYVHPRLSSARKELGGHSFGLSSASNPTGLRSSDMAKQQNDVGPAAHTDFNNVTQFSLSSQKQKHNFGQEEDYRKQTLF